MTRSVACYDSLMETDWTGFDRTHAAWAAKRPAPPAYFNTPKTRELVASGVWKPPPPSNPSLTAIAAAKYKRDHAEEWRKGRVFRFLRECRGAKVANSYALKENLDVRVLENPHRWSYWPLHGWIEQWMWDGWYANPTPMDLLNGAPNEKVLCIWRPWKVQAFRNLKESLEASPRCPKAPLTLYWLDAERLLSEDRKRKLAVDGCQHKDHSEHDHGDPRCDDGTEEKEASPLA